MPLSVRVWNGEACRVLHDRDVNAALNILAAGQVARSIRPMLVEVWVRRKAAIGQRSAPSSEARILAPPPIDGG